MSWEAKKARAKGLHVLWEAGLGIRSYRNKGGLEKGVARGNSRRKETQGLQSMLLINVIMPEYVLMMWVRMARDTDLTHRGSLQPNISRLVII